MVERVYHLRKGAITDERMCIAINNFPVFTNIDMEAYDYLPDGTAFTLIIKCRKEDMRSIDELLKPREEI